MEFFAERNDIYELEALPGMNALIIAFHLEIIAIYLGRLVNMLSAAFHHHIQVFFLKCWDFLVV